MLRLRVFLATQACTIPAMAGAVDNEDRVMTAAAMYDCEASVEDYGD
jgi:hypothetical protein